METRPKGLFAVDKFFDRTPDGPVLVGSRCTECGKVCFPRKNVCYKCFRKDCMEVHPLAKHGEIVTYSIAHMSHIGMETPYAFGYVYLPEDNITIYSLFTDWDPPEEKLFIGQQVEQCIDTFRDDPWGNAIVTYLYRCVGTKSDFEAARK